MWKRVWSCKAGPLARSSWSRCGGAGGPSGLEPVSALAPTVPGLKLAQPRRPNQGHGRAHTAAQAGGTGGRGALPARRRLSPNRMRHNQIRRLAHPEDLITGSLSQLQPLQIQELSRRPETLPSLTHCCISIITWATAAPSGKPASLWCGPGGGGIWPVSCLARRLGRRGGGMPSLAGRRRSARGNCIRWPTTAGF